MIIETFGPPGAGKTTFTEALAQRLREHDYAVDLMLTLPHIQNRFLSVGGFIPAIARVSRAIAITITILWQWSKNAQGLRLARDLLRLMPPKDIIWRIRLSQYVMRFACVWSETHRHKPKHIVIFDQGFVQVALTLALFSEADKNSIARAMELRAKPDLIIHLDAPQPLLAKRLHARVNGKPVMERWFEADVETFLKAKPIVGYLGSLLEATGDPMIDIKSLDQARLNEALELIEREIAARFAEDSADQASTAPPVAPERHAGPDAYWDPVSSRTDWLPSQGRRSNT